MDFAEFDILRSMMPQMDIVVVNEQVLSDPRRRSEYPAATSRILRALAAGAALALRSDYRQPQVIASIPYPDPTYTRFFFSLGSAIHENLLQQGLLWPPPYVQPPPAATRDLLQLYRAAAHRRHLEGHTLGLDLGLALERVRAYSLLLADTLEFREHQGLIEAGAVTIARDLAGSPQNARGSRTKSLLAGLGIVITLLQGPGAVHDFPEDSAQLMSDAQSAIAVLAAGAVELGEQVGRALERGWAEQESER